MASRGVKPVSLPVPLSVTYGTNDKGEQVAYNHFEKTITCRGCKSIKIMLPADTPHSPDKNGLEVAWIDVYFNHYRGKKRYYKNNYKRFARSYGYRSNYGYRSDYGR